jgi:hypothetical protein
MLLPTPDNDVSVGVISLEAVIGGLHPHLDEYIRYPYSQSESTKRHLYLERHCKINIPVELESK